MWESGSHTVETASAASVIQAESGAGSTCDWQNRGWLRLVGEI